jgi:hypothetical protein
MHRTPLATLVAAVAFATAATAQSIPLPLNYNWNGIVHLGEDFQPDNPTGFRSISDRALDFSNGVPADPLLAGYALVTNAGALDLVHLGNRNTVDFGNWVFDALPDGDDIGDQPLWLPNPDQTGPQTTVLPTPLPIAPSTVFGLLYQISNGGGSFDVTFGWLGGGSHTVSVSAGDWFGGTLPGRQNVDTGATGANLSVTEARLGLGAFSGQVLGQVTFSNRSNANAGVAILAANLEYPPAVRRVNQIPLAYNWNGIVHAGEGGQPDAVNGYRSISDRGLDFSAGVPQQPLLAPYRLVDTAGQLDLVHLGNRNTVDGGQRAFDLVADGDDIGIQPAWLANPDQTGPQVTTLADPILLDAGSRASVLFQISNGGGTFDVGFGFQSGAPLFVTMSGGDWFGGPLPGTGFTDRALVDNNLSLTERSVDLSAHAGRTLTSITFSNRSNSNAGYAIAAMNVSGCLSCVNGTQGSVVNLGGGNGAQMTTTSDGCLGCDLDWTVLGATPNAALGFLTLGLGATSLPLGGLVVGCTGTVHVANPVAVLVPVDATGSATLAIPAPTGQGLCGVLVTGQYFQLRTGACTVLASDAISITIGN